MSKQESTALAKASGQEKLEVIRKGANLPEERWTEERVLAAVRLLPERFQDPANAIGFLAMAHSYDLDPFAKEIWGWEQKGKLQVMVSRDGWTKILRRDPDVASVQADQVRQEDEFYYERDELGKVVVHHKSSPFSAGPVVGAYALVRMEGEKADIIQARSLEDYKHLRGKDNWREHGQEMILTRVISFAGRLATGAAIHTEADFQLREDALEDHLQTRTDEQEGELLATLNGDEDEGQEPEEVGGVEDEPEQEQAEPEPEPEPVEAEATEEEVEDEEPEPAEPLPELEGEPVEVADRFHLAKDMAVREQDGKFHVYEGEDLIGLGPDLVELLEDLLPHGCEVCGHRFATGHAKGGHSRSHSMDERREAREAVEEENARSEAAEEVQEDEADGDEGFGWAMPEFLTAEHPNHGEPEDIRVMQKGTPEGYAVAKIVYGAGTYRYQGVVVNEDGHPVEPVGKPAVGRMKALQAVDEHSGMQGDLLDDQLEIDPSEYEDVPEGQILMDIYQLVEELGEDGSEKVYQLAGEIQGLDEGETARMKDLDREQKIELLERMKQLV